MSKTRRIAVDGMLAALYFALSALIVNLRFPLGDLQVRFTALALITAALLFSTFDACAVALIGELLYQLLFFGLSATTPVWLLPPVLHALLLGLSAAWIRRRVSAPRQNAAFFAACLVCGLLNAVFNTAALYVDSHVFGYYRADTFFVMALIRLGVGVLTAALTAGIAIPLVRLLQKSRS